jgi:general secretion pathway protein M
LVLPSGRNGRLLALAILCLMLGSIYLLIVSPLLGLYRQRETMLADRQMLAPRLSARAAELPDLEKRLAELKAAASTNRITLEGASDAIASANLQSQIEGLAATARVLIVSTEGVPAEDRGGYRRIGLRITVGGEYEAIVKLLAAIDKAAPPLILGNLELRGSLSLIGDPAAGRLDAGFQVYGFRNGETPVALQQ